MAGRAKGKKTSTAKPKQQARQRGFNALVKRLSPLGSEIRTGGGFVVGTATTREGKVAVIGTTGGVHIDNAGALVLSKAVLACVEKHPKRPIVMLVDTEGQAPRREAEMLGLANYFGHLLSCLQLAREQEHQLLTIATGKAIGGAFICYGMFADQVYALDSAEVGPVRVNESGTLVLII